MYAIVQTGGKQYKVETGDQIRVEKIDGEPGTEIVLDKVLAVADAGDIQLWTPLVENKVVKATILRTDRSRKIVVFKKKRRKAYYKRQGHRQWFTLLRIDSIGSTPDLMVESAPSSQTTSTEA